MSTKRQQKRKTKQVRINEKLHQQLKLEAVAQGKSISWLADSAVRAWLRK